MCASRGATRAPLTTDSLRPDGSSSSSLSPPSGALELGSSVPPVSVQMNDCWARLTIWPMHLSKLLDKVIMNKEKNDVIPDMMLGSIPLDVVLFTQNVTHNMHCYIVSRSIIRGNIAYLVIYVITM